MRDERADSEADACSDIPASNDDATLLGKPDGRRGARTEQPAGLFRDGAKNPLGVWGGCDERGDPTERRLFVN